MAQRKADALVKSVKVVLAERAVVTAKERELVRSVKAVLNKIGYQVLPLGGLPRSPAGGAAGGEAVLVGRVGSPGARRRRGRGGGGGGLRRHSQRASRTLESVHL